MRRRALLGLLALAGCGLSERPYTEKRQWPLAVARPSVLPPRRGGRILLVRDIRAAPGLEARGLQSLQPDGSLRVNFYEEWAVPPAVAVEDGLRDWLAASGRFAAVVAPGSRLAADRVLEGTLTALLADPSAGTARAALSVVLIDPRPSARILLQQAFSATQPLASADPPAVVQALLRAVADILAAVEAAVGAYA